MKARKLTHTLNTGEVFTRTTKRDYTHVLVVTQRAHLILADLERTPLELDKVAKDAAYDWKHAMHILATPVGEKAFYHRNQGGAYLNKTGKHQTVQQYHHDIENEYFAPYTLEAYVAKEVAARLQRRQDAIDSAKATVETPHVYSWHSRKDLAEKAGSQLCGCDWEVQEING